MTSFEFDDKFELKQLILSYSTNTKKYAKWFEISEVEKNEGAYTKYKVVYRFLPKDINEPIKELTVWKRFNDFKELYKVLSNYHVRLHRKDVFPEFAKPKFFGRFDDKVIEERKKAAQLLLQFIGCQSHLYKHEKFIEFLMDSKLQDHSFDSDKNILQPTPVATSQNANAGIKEADESAHEANSNDQINPIIQSDANILKDWILSDFNLLSDDFNNELSKISGNLFDFNFTYKFFRMLNQNCFFVKNRHLNDSSQKSEEFLVKRIKKSPMPNLLKKTIVPFANQIPHMCSLFKYYESEDTIFLFIEYAPLGKLFSYLSYLQQAGDSFQSELTKILTDKKHKAIPSRSTLNKKLNNSTSCIVSLYKQENENNSGSKRRHQSFMSSIDLGTLNKRKLLEVEFGKDLLPANEDSSPNKSSDTSSTQSLSICLDMTNKISNCGDELSRSKSEDISNNEEHLVLHENKIHYHKSNELPSKQDEIVAKSNNDYIENSFYFKQVKIWLSQLFKSIRSLHRLGIICKDLRPANVLLNLNGDLMLTYFSKWNLVDEIINKNAIKSFYAAPEISSMLNYEISEACDYWSFGVLAYEMLTMKKFTELNSTINIYINNVSFPDEFKHEIGKDLIRGLIRMDPSSRLGEEKIQKHKFFDGIDFTDC